MQYPYAAEIDVHHALEFVVAGVQKRGDLGIHTGVVERRVGPSMGADHALGHLGQRLFAAIGEDNGPSGHGEGFRRRQTDAGGGSGHKCDFSFEQ
jgi:hypothetical protein